MNQFLQIIQLLSACPQLEHLTIKSGARVGHLDGFLPRLKGNMNFHVTGHDKFPYFHQWI